MRTGRPVATIMAASGFRQIPTPGALGPTVDVVLAANPAAVADVRVGKAQVIGFLIGPGHHRPRGQANAARGPGGDPGQAGPPPEGEAI